MDLIFGQRFCNFQTYTSILAVILFMLALPFRSVAQYHPDTLTGVLDDILIEATRLTETGRSAPFSVSIERRSSDEQRFEPALTLDRVLASVPGLWINNRENFALGERVSIRGMGWRAAFGVRGIYVLLDGIPLTMPDGQSVLDIIDPAFIRQAEVIRGPSSSFWGNAGGGTIFLSTRAPAHQPSARIRTFGGSYHSRKIEVSTVIPHGNHQFNLFGSYLDHDGFRDHSSHRSLRMGGHAGFRLSADTDLSITGAFVNAPFSRHPGSLTLEDAREYPRMATPLFVQAGAGKSWLQGQTGIMLSHRLNLGTLSATVYGLSRQLHNPLTFADIEVDRLAGGSRLALQNDTGQLSWGVGVDASVQRDDRKNYNYRIPFQDFTRNDLVLDQTETVNNTALFSRLGMRFGRFNLTGSLRYDYLFFSNDDHLVNGDDQSGNRSFSSFSPSAGLSYRFLRNLAYFNINTAFESPTTTELVNRPDMTGGFNPELEPERTVGFETGFRGFLAFLNLEYDLAVFTMEVRNRLIPYTVMDRTFYLNEGSTRHNGFESWLSWQPDDDIVIEFSYTFSRFTFSDAGDAGAFGGNLLPGIPQQRILGDVAWTPGNLLISLRSEYIGRYYTNNDNTVSNPSSLVSDLQLAWRDLSLTRNLFIQPFLKVNNITDTRYNASVSVNATGGRYFEPAPGRIFFAGFSLEI